MWKQDEQWAPLWDDVRLLAERVSTDPQAYEAPPVPPQFLGVITLDQMQTAIDDLEVRHVVDGQRRLSTCSCCCPPLWNVVRELGNPMGIQALTGPIRNQLMQAPDDVLSVWPTPRTRTRSGTRTRDALHGDSTSRVREGRQHASDPTATGIRPGHG